MFREADVLSIHSALTSETMGMVGAAELALMKREAVLVKCAGGVVVQEAALADALRAKTIAGEAVDVFEREPTVGIRLLTALTVALTKHRPSRTTNTTSRI